MPTYTQTSTAGQSRPASAKRVLLADPRGFCAGVDRAVETVEQALKQHGPPVYVRNEIVHNQHVVRALSKRGVVFVSDTNDVPPGALMILSAHGVSPTVWTAARERDLNVIDATCPLVTKVHAQVQRFASRGYDILLVGHPGHEEVQGICGEAPDHVQVIDGEDAIDRVAVSDEAKLVWLSQTTLSVDETKSLVAKIRQRFPLLQDPPSDDICYATQNRQAAVKAMAPHCDLVIVVGSHNSSNSVRLLEVACQAGAKEVRRVDHAAELNISWLEAVSTIGVTSGASVPEILVQEVLIALADRGFHDVRHVHTADETVRFALPRMGLDGTNR